LSAEEERLWRHVAATARPYRRAPERSAPEEAPAAPASTAPAASSVKTPAPDLAALVRHGVGGRARPSPHAPATTPAKLVADASGHRKVRRGKLDIEARFDLHGLRQPEAETLLAGFLVRCREAGMRCVLVVTGKGRPVDPAEDFLTPQPGVIRRRLPEWLSAPGVRPHVSGFASAHPRHGGAGAYYVLLKARKDAG
jgi:DNA-nicking Smr family endonuclease